MAQLTMIISFVLYFIVLIKIGMYFYKKQSTVNDFLMGNRSVNYWVTAIATQASDMGSWLFLGLPAAVYVNGLFSAWVALGLIVGMYATWQFIAPRLREQTAALDSLTLSSFFAHRFNDTRGILQLTSSLLSLLFFTFYIASGLVSLSLLFESAFGIPYQIGIVASLATAAAYALIGGFVAIAWCDFFQGIFLMCMIVLVPVVAWWNLPHGISDIIANAYASHKSLSLWGNPGDMLYAIFLAAGWGLGYFGQPHILINFMGIDDPKTLNLAKRVGMSWQILVLAASVSIGMISIGYFAPETVNPQLVFVHLTTMLFSPFIAGIILCAILAATLSTIDSLILAGGATIAKDIYGRFVNRNASARTLVLVSRIGAVCTSLVALAIAWNNDQSVYQLVEYAWSGLGSSFGPLVIMSLYSTSITLEGALAGMITGGCMSALWPYQLPLIPGFFSGIFVMYGISFIQKKLFANR